MSSFYSMAGCLQGAAALGSPVVYAFEGLPWLTDILGFFHSADRS
jgi:hypothetical protein